MARSNDNLNVEAWLDEHPEFVHNYFFRKVTRSMIDEWLMAHSSQSVVSSSVPGVTSAASANTALISANTQTNLDKDTIMSSSNRSNSSGSATPVRKISAHEFERSGLLKPMVTNTSDGTPTFLTDENMSSVSLNLVGKNRHELKKLDEKELIFELVKDICNDLDVRSLCHKILQNVSILLNADRGSLFLVQGDRNNGFGGGGCTPGRATRDRCLVSKLFDVCSKSTIVDIEKQSEIRIPWGTGIVGYVAESGEPVNIPDAYKDKRFNSEIDSYTGYHTKTLLCMPIKDMNGDVIGVAQVINKLDESPFTKYDENVFQRYLQFCGIGLQNAHLFERSQLEIRRNQVLLDLARMIFEEQSTIEHVVFRILNHMQSLIQCQRVQILLLHQSSKASFSRVFDFESNDLQLSGIEQRNQPFESRFPINSGITGYVATTGETVNIANAYDDDRFDRTIDDGSNFKHKNILCMAIKNSSGKIIGVIQLVNKYIDLPFTKNDENFVEAFAIFCGMGIHNTNMYEKAVIAIAKQNVTLEVLSYHASASLEDAIHLKELKVPSAVHYRLHDVNFDDLSLKDEETLTACLRMFLDLQLIETFQIDYTVLCRWLLSVKKNYRNVTYHNWRHAFNVAQMMFSILLTTSWQTLFGQLDCLGLIIACLCHDLDHRGTNNSFQIKACSALAQLYSTSTMEHHHFDQCLMILNSPGNQILANVSSENYSRIVKVLEDAILSTDLAVYFRRRSAFLALIKETKDRLAGDDRKGGVTGGGSNGEHLWQAIDWTTNEENCELLRAMLMTICDLSAITKPWEVEKRVADLVSSEFFQQGDIEKEELHITPIDIMNREKSDQLPLMQVGFIDSICLPIYQAFEELSSDLKPLADGVRENKRNWLKLASDSISNENGESRSSSLVSLNSPSSSSSSSSSPLTETARESSKAAAPTPASLSETKQEFLPQTPRTPPQSNATTSPQLSK